MFLHKEMFRILSEDDELRYKFLTPTDFQEITTFAHDIPVTSICQNIWKTNKRW